MDPEIVDRVTGWEPVGTAAGTVDLGSLAAEEFSGAVSAAGTWAFLLNGRIVGVFDGDVEALADGAELDAYRAPDPALPLLLVMQETGGEERAKYYTKETPLHEVDRTLSSGNFTGYVELSENVLSGDYYVVYHGGRSMSVAFVGASERLVTGDEAFELADDEVGIYSVTAVDVDVVDLPDGASAAATTDRSDAGGRGDAGAAGGAGSVTFDDDDGTGDDAPERTAERADDAGGHGRGDGELGGGMGIGLGAAGTDESAADGTTDRGPRSAATDPEAAPDAGDDDPDDAEAGRTAGATGADERERSDEERSAGTDPTDVDGAPGDGSATGDATNGDPTGGATATDVGEAPDADATDVDETPDADATDVDEAPDADATPEPVSDDPSAARNSVAAGDDASADGAPAATAGDGKTDDGATRPGDGGASAFAAERQWQETRRIPALGPEESMDRDDPAAGADDPDPAAAPDDGATAATDGTSWSATDDGRASASGAAAEAEPDTEPATEPEPGPEPESGSGAGAGPGPQPEPEPDDGASVAGRESEPDAVPESEPDAVPESEPDAAGRAARLRAERDELAARVESLESDLAAVADERDRLSARVRELESELERLRAADGDGSGERLSPAAARAGTNLFVRYRSKGKPTLKKARSGDARQEEVVENLRLEYHTTFDSESTTVGGERYEAFLRGTTEWQFVTWVVEELLYEIGRSGHRSDLAPLFDRIPEIDRIQFDGEVAVTVADAESGGDSHESRTFDLVFRDSMGDPLFVADVDTDRDATTGSMVGSLIEGARAVGTSKDTLAGAFYVTTSFFEPDALDAVGEATKSGLLSRNAKKSFVKLSRKQGYHLCLVEARDDEVHMSVPEL